MSTPIDPAFAPTDLSTVLASPDIGDKIYNLASEIFPICRSITGDGIRQTLKVMARHANIDTREVPSGTDVFDWTIPDEWTIRDAHIRAPSGQKIIDFKDNNLHVLSYSAPVHKSLTLDELKLHLHSLPEQPNIIPFRSSYYSRAWGFCLPHRQLQSLSPGVYEVVVDSTLEPGALSYGEYLHKGESEQEVLLSAHICHPSLANDNCSGLALLTQLASKLKGVKTRLSYRFLFAPALIGSVAWLSRNEDKLHRIVHGLVVSCVGDSGGPTYKRSRRQTALVDRAAAHVLAHSSSNHTLLDFEPYGYDERQFCSPKLDLPVGLFMRSKFGEFSQYHTSADNMDFITPKDLGQSFGWIVEMLDILENDLVYINTSPECEPQLGKRGLTGPIGGNKAKAEQKIPMLWVLNLSDGKHSLLDIAERSNVPFQLIRDAAKSLYSVGLLRPAAPSETLKTISALRNEKSH